VKAPKPLDAFSYLMVWHPRMNSDAAHTWLRQTIVKVAVAIKKSNSLNATRVEAKMRSPSI
jgi:hypothetical protein